MYKPEYFKLYELVPKDYYNKYGTILWYLFDNRILIMADSLRKRYGKLIINDWYWNGTNQYRGWRPFDTNIGAKFSQHKWGRALDIIPQEVESSVIRKDIKSDPNNYDFRFITCIEDFEGMSWVHIDCRNWDKDKNGILIVKP